MALIGEDCHFFLTSGCVRGNQCAFRHQPAARTTEVACPDWIQGNCLKFNCGLRHIPVDRSSISSRKTTPCYYDSQPTGCLKANCPFLHVKKPAIVQPGTSVISTAQNHVVSEKSFISQPQLVVVPPAVVKQPVATPQVAPPPQAIKKAVIPPPAPVHSLEPAVPRPTIVNGVLHLAPTRGILGAPPGVQVMPPQVLVNQNQPPHILQQHQVMARPPVVHAKQLRVLHQPLNPAYPKSEHFNEQVRLFKELLSTKQKNHPRKQNHKNYYDVVDSGDERKQQEKGRERSRRNKKEKEKQATKSKKKSKDGWTKADEEVLYGDYKDIPLEKKHKKSSKADRHAGSDSEVNVKSYEEVLREKALRKLLEKRKEKFNDDFDDILLSKEKPKKVTKTKKYSSDGDETVDTKYKHSSRKSKKESIDLENEVFSKEDAVELEIDADDDEFNDTFSTETEEVKRKQKAKKQSKDKKRKNSTERENREKERKHSTEETKEDSKETDAAAEIADASEHEEVDNEDTSDLQAEEGGVLIIPDETTDLTFSVDDTDDLALELNEVETMKDKKKPTSSSRKPVSSSRKYETSSRKPDNSSTTSKKISSVVRFVSKSTINLKKSQNKKTDKAKCPEVSETKEKAKRKIMVVDTPVESKKSKDESVMEVKDEKKKVITLARKDIAEKSKDSNTASKEAKPKYGIKIKTFEEIMAEKRKRKLQDKEVVVLSDSDTSLRPDSPMKSSEHSPMKLKEPLQVRSEKIKSQILSKQPVRDGIETAVMAEPPKFKSQILGKQPVRDSDETAVTVEPPKSAAQLRREKLKAAREEYEKRRKSQQLYQPKSAVHSKETASTNVKDEAAPTTNSNSAPVPLKKIRLQRVADAPAAADKVKVRTFEEIMEEKRLRKQKEGHNIRGKIDSKPIQSFLRRAVGRNTEPKAAESSKVTTTTPATTATETSNVARVPPLQVTKIRNSSSSSSINDDIKNPLTVSTTKITNRRRSGSPGVVPQTVTTKPTAVVKIKRPSTSDCEVPSLSPLPNDNVVEKTDNQQPSLNDTNTLPSSPVETKIDAITQSSMQDIQEALDEKKRLREEDMLSDDEFEKEMNDLISDGDDDDDVEDVDDDDFMMELQQMIDN